MQCTSEIKTWIALAKSAFKKKKTLFTRHLVLISSNKLDKMLYSEFYGVENGHSGR